MSNGFTGAGRASSCAYRILHAAYLAFWFDVQNRSSRDTCDPDGSLLPTYPSPCRSVSQLSASIGSVVCSSPCSADVIARNDAAM